jgi:hypothetical protein
MENDDISKILETFKAATFAQIPYRDTLEVLNADLKRLEARRAGIVQAIAEVSSLTYKRGEVVFNKEFGNGIVVAPFVDSIFKLYTDWGSSPPNAPEGWTKESPPGYVVHFVTVGKDGRITPSSRFIPQDELAPYSETTKVLFDGQ